MSESVTDRPTRSYEYVMLLAKQSRYFYDRIAIAEPLARPNEGKRKTPGRFGGADKHTETGKQSRLHSSNEYLGTPTGTRNARDVWSIATCGFKGAHFAVYPRRLVEPCILAGTSERGCCPRCGAPWRRIIASNPPDPLLRAVYAEDSSKHVTAGRNSSQRRLAESTTAGRLQTGDHDAPFRAPTTLGWRPGCACKAPPGLHPEDLDVIRSPLCRGQDREDPTLEVGRAGYSRPRQDGEGIHYVTRYEQRQYAAQLKTSAHRNEMEAEAGDAFAHYLRADRSGARPIPQPLLESWIERGWLVRVGMPVWNPPRPVPCVVLDPFSGSGTTLVVARKLGRSGIGIDLSPDYIRMAANRIGEGVTILGSNSGGGDGH
jgi:hypothetical protein